MPLNSVNGNSILKKKLFVNNTSKDIEEILNGLKWLLDVHDSFVELVEVKGNTVFLQIGGQCMDCESSCIKEALKE
ncbi:MAG: NifU family protein, partial [Candidatus Mariimomonas ferrooxydans]